jgi:hypothetical protein
LYSTKQEEPEMENLSPEEVRAVYVLMLQSHVTYMRQKTADLNREGKTVPDFDPVPTLHDLERAVDGVRALAAHGLVISLSGAVKEQ